MIVLAFGETTVVSTHAVSDPTAKAKATSGTARRRTISSVRNVDSKRGDKGKIWKRRAFRAGAAVRVDVSSRIVRVEQIHNAEERDDRRSEEMSRAREADVDARVPRHARGVQRSG